MAVNSKDLDAIPEPLFSGVLRCLQLLKKSPKLGGRMLGRITGYRSAVVSLFEIVYRFRPEDARELAYTRDCRRRASKR